MSVDTTFFFPKEIVQFAHETFMTNDNILHYFSNILRKLYCLDEPVILRCPTNNSSTRHCENDFFRDLIHQDNIIGCNTQQTVCHVRLTKILHL